jgi:hypothetical protein
LPQENTKIAKPFNNQVRCTRSILWSLRFFVANDFTMLQQVHLRVNDAATGKPTPVRLRITDAQGTYYAPYGRLTEFATGVNQDVGGNVQIGAKKWAYIDGACEILLPPGTLHIEITKGPEFKPIDEEIQLLAGKLALRFTIERWSDVRKQGWYSGDAGVTSVPPDTALLEGQAKDLAVVNLLAVHTQKLFAQDSGKFVDWIDNILSFSGQSFARQAGGCGVAVNTLNHRSGLANPLHLGLLNCHRVVYPLVLDANDDNWTAEDWCDQCHRKNGLVVLSRHGWTTDYRSCEYMAVLIRGSIDAIELEVDDAMLSSRLLRFASGLPSYYELLDMEFVIPLMGSRPMRTYAYIRPDQEFNYSNWIEAVRAGRTFVSNGPLIHFTINGEVPTHTHSTSVSANTIQIRADAKSLTQYHHLELLWNGNVIQSVPPEKSFPYQAILEHNFPVRESGWLAVRCVTDEAAGPPYPLAHTSPIAIRVAESPRWAREDAVRATLDRLDEVIAWTRTRTHPARPRLVRLYEETRTVLAKKLS